MGAPAELRVCTAGVRRAPSVEDSGRMVTMEAKAPTPGLPNNSFKVGRQVSPDATSDVITSNKSTENLVHKNAHDF